MDLISFSEMDIGNMKRKELQALCKKNKIPANLTNLEMANRLTDLLKENEKPIAKSKSCIRSTTEQAIENHSNDLNRLSKKVRFSPENETYEFLASDIKPNELGRRARAKKRAMLRQVEGIGGIVIEKNVENVKSVKDNAIKSVKVTRSLVTKDVDEVENVVNVKGIKRGRRAVPVVETRMLRRSSKTKEVEKSNESGDDALSLKNQSKRTLRNRGTKMNDKASEIENASKEKTKEVNDELLVKKNVSKITRRGRTVNSGQESLENKTFLEVDLGQLEVVRKGRSKRQCRQSVDNTNEAVSKSECELEVVLEIEEPVRRSSRYKNETENNTSVQGNALNDNAKPNRNFARRNSNKPNNRSSDPVLEDRDLVIEGSSVVEELRNRPRRNSIRRQSIVPRTEKTGTDGSKGKNEKNSETSSVEEVPKRKSSRRDSIVALGSATVEDLKKQKPTGRKMDLIVEEEEPAVEGSLVGDEETREPAQNDDIEKVNCEESGSGSGLEVVLNIDSDNSHEGTEGLIGKPSISGLEVVLNFNTEDELDTGNVHLDFESNHLALSNEVKSNDTKGLDLTEAPLEQSYLRVDQPRCLAKQAENFVLAKELGIIEHIESETQASGTLKFQNDDDKAQGVIGVEDDSDADNLSPVEPEVELEKNNSVIEQPECIAPTADNMGLEEDLVTCEEADPHVQECRSYNAESTSVTSVLPECGLEPIEPNDVVCPDATLEDEGHQQLDKSAAVADPVENLELEDFAICENTNSGKRIVLQCAVSDDAIEVETIYDSEEKCSVEKNNPNDVEGIDTLECEKLIKSSGGISYHGVDVENKYSIEVEHDVEQEGVLENSNGENKSIEVESIQRHGLDRSALLSEVCEYSIGKEQHVVDISAQNKGISSPGDFFRNASAESKYSCVLHSSEKGTFVELTDGKELSSKFDGEDQLAQEKESIAIETFGISDEEKKDSSLLDTSNQKETTSFQVEVEQKGNEISGPDSELVEGANSCTPMSMEKREAVAETLVKSSSSVFKVPTVSNHISFEQQIAESVQRSSVVSSGKAASLKEQKHSRRASTPMSVSKEIKSLLEVEQKDLEISGPDSELVEGANSCTPMPMEKREAVAQTLTSMFKVPTVSDPISFEQQIAESVQRSSVVSSGKAANLNEQNHSIRASTPMSVSKEIKSLMMVDLDWTPASEFRKVHSDALCQDDHVPSAFPIAEPVDDQNENSSRADCRSYLPGVDNVDKPISPKETFNSGEQSIYQYLGMGGSREFEDSERTENVSKLSAENEIQLFEASSSQTTSGSAEHLGNCSTSVEVSPTELRLLFDDKSQHNVDSGALAETYNGVEDACNEGILMGTNLATEKDNSTEVVIDGEMHGPIKYKDEDTQVIGSFNDDGFADTPFVEMNASPSALKSVQTSNSTEEENTGNDVTVSVHDHDNAVKEINSLGDSDIFVDENALENATSYPEAVVADKNNEDVLMEDRDSITRVHEGLTPVEIDSVAMELDEASPLTRVKLFEELEYEEIVNADREVEEVDTQFDDGMFDDLCGDEMEMVQELVDKDRDDSPCLSDQFLGHEKTHVEENPSSSKDNSSEEDEVEVQKTAVNDTEKTCSGSEFQESMESSENQTAVQRVDEFIEYQNFSKVSQHWSPDPGFGFSQASFDSSVYSSWELDLFSKVEASKSTPVGSNIPGTERDNTDAIVNEEIKTCDVSVDKPLESSDGSACGAVASEDLRIGTIPHDNLKQSNLLSMNLDDAVSSFQEEQFRSESYVREGEHRSGAVGKEVAELDIDDDLSLFQTDVNDAVADIKYAEVLEQATTVKTGNRSGSGEFLEVVADETEDGLENQRLGDVKDRIDNLHEHTQVENFSQDRTPNAAGDDKTLVPSSFDKEVENEFGIDENDNLSSIQTTCKTLKMEKQSSLIQGTPKKLATAFDMKENAVSVKRETMGSVTVKSTVKRRALSELHK